MTQSMLTMRDIVQQLHATHGLETESVQHPNVCTVGKGLDSTIHPIVLSFDKENEKNALKVRMRRSVLEPYTTRPLPRVPNGAPLPNGYNSGLFCVKVGASVSMSFRADPEFFHLSMSAGWYQTHGTDVWAVLRFVLDLHLAQEDGLAIEEGLNTGRY